MRNTFYEFFAGGGMVSQGLGEGWQCSFANDIEPMKAEAYRANHPKSPFVLGDIAKIKPADLPGEADLAWASFPCQDLSLAGAGAGLAGGRSGLFWSFWRLMKRLAKEGRAPKIITLENVVGAITSHEGRDLAAIAKAFADSGYHFGCLVIDAAHFVPQSRPRLFVVGVRGDLHLPPELFQPEADPIWHSKALVRSMAGFGRKAAAKSVFWRLPPPPLRNTGLRNFIEDEPAGVEWHKHAYTKRLLSMMDTNNRNKVREAQRTKRLEVGTIYRRTRPDGNGGKVQRAEVRFDDVAGCLRTPAGGSSRQTLLIVNGRSLKSRLLSPREAARLMGLPDEYRLPERYNDAYHLAGDGVAVPAVRFLAENIFEPILIENQAALAAQ